MTGRKLFVSPFSSISCGWRVVAVTLSAVMRFKTDLVMSLVPRDPHHSLDPIGNSPPLYLPYLPYLPLLTLSPLP